MENRKRRCSTPVNGRETIRANPVWSEIRKRKINGRSADEVDSVPVPKKRSKHQPCNFNQKSGNKDVIIIDSSSDEDNPNLSRVQLLQSPSDKNNDNYELEYLNSLEDDTLSIFSDPVVISRPVVTNRFGDGTQVKTYSGPGLGKPRLSPSQISFSPKWVNRVPSKYNSPSDIPASKAAVTFLSPGSASWSSEASSPTENRMCEDFVKVTKSLPKSSTYIKRKRSVQKNRYKVLKSPTHKSVLDDEKNYPQGWVVVNMQKKQFGKYESPNVNATSNRAKGNNVSKAETLIFRNTSPNIQHSESESGAIKKAKSSPKYNAINSERYLGESSKTNNKSTSNTDCSLLGIGSPPPKKSKVRIISMKTVKKPFSL